MLQECFVSPGELRKGGHLTINANTDLPEGIPVPNWRTTRLDCAPCTILLTIRNPQGYWATLKGDERIKTIGEGQSNNRRSSMALT